MLTIIALLFAAALPPTDPAPLVPTGKWTVEYADTMCVLSRDYGAGKDRLTLGLRPWPMGTTTEIVLVTQNHAATFDGGHAEVTLLPAQHTVTGSYSRYPLPNGSGRLAMMEMGEEALAGIEKAAAIRIRLGNNTRSFAIPGIVAAMTALATCQNDLLKSWGLDPNERTVVVTPPKGNPGAFFNNDDYPPAAIRAHQEGRTVAVASIDSTGKVTACAVAASSGSAALDQATCEVLKNNGHFSPGRNKDGKPIASHLVVPVRWIMP